MNLDLANSWFVLAQILATIAGFLFISAGMSLSHRAITNSTSAQINASNRLFETRYKPRSKLEKFIINYGIEIFFCSGIIFVFLSLATWFLGRLALN